MLNFFKETINIFKLKKGLSILEVIMAIGIIAIGLVGIMSLVIQNVQVQYINRDILIASQLAQEGLELTRNIRDKNWLDFVNRPWAFQDIAIAEPASGSKTFRILFGLITDDVTGIDDIDAKLFINSSGYYSYDSSGTETVFSRIIETDHTTTNPFIDVSCIVQWTERGQAQQYIADTILYDWR